MKALGTLVRRKSSTDFLKRKSKKDLSEIVNQSSLEDPLPTNNDEEVSFQKENRVSDVPTEFSPKSNSIPIPQNILPTDQLLSQKERLRNQVINEIINTERQYVEDLQTIVSCFLNPMKLNQELVPQASLNSIFSNVEILLNVNKTLLSDLESQAKQFGGVGIGICFINLADYLKMYSIYCSNQKYSLDTIEQLAKKPPWKEFLQSLESNPQCKGLLLNSFLIKPIQRICKYPLLLRELIKNTSQDSKDMIHLQNAAEKIEEVVQVVNTAAKEDENRAKILEIQMRHEGGGGISILSPGRRFVKEGIVGELVGDKRPPKVQEMQYFLFSDLLVRSSFKLSNKFQCKTMIPLEQLSISNPKEHLFVVMGNVFEIVHMGENQKFTVFVAKKEEKQEWMNTILTLLPNRIEDEIDQKNQRNSVYLHRDNLSALQNAKNSRKSLPPPPPKPSQPNLTQPSRSHSRSLPAPPMDITRKFRCIYEDTRMIEVSLQNILLEDVHEKIRIKFGVDFTFVIRFKDKEEDLITLINQEDLNWALKMEIQELYLYYEPETLIDW